MTRKRSNGRPNGGRRAGAGRKPGPPTATLQAVCTPQLVAQVDAAAEDAGVSRSRYVVGAVERAIGASVDEDLITEQERDSLLGIE